MRRIKVATVFSGIGAFEFSLKRLNVPHDIVFACDNGEVDIDYDSDLEMERVKSLNGPHEKCAYANKLYSNKTNKTNFVKKSYLANYSQDNLIFFQDIKLLDGTDFKNQIDIFVGGSPCQSFSSVGFQHGLEDTRGTLFYEYARLVKEIQPKAFIYENVRNLINHDKGKTWDIIRDVFNSLGYKISFAVLNAGDYGIPQNRRRLFIVGFLDNSVDFSFPQPSDLKFNMFDFLENNCSFGNFTYSKNGKLKITKKYAEIDKKYYLTPLLYNYVMKGGTKSFYQNPKINNNIARPLLKTMGNRHRAGIDNYVSDDGSKDFGKVRMLTEREAHRLMGFTDDYKIVVSKAQAYKQAGNSIVVDLLMQILNEIFRHLQ